MKMIIFDMDGTLINSGYAIANTVNYVRENLNLEKLEKNFILEKVNDPNINTSEFFYGTKEFTQKQTTLFKNYYDKNCLKDLTAYEGITELLYLLKKDFTLTVATNAHSDYAKKMLEYLDLKKYFSTILGYNDVIKPKPNPEMLNKLLDKYKIKKENSQLIGDSQKDILAAKNAGIDSILVNWGFSNHYTGAIENISDLEEKIFNKFKG